MRALFAIMLASALAVLSGCGSGKETSSTASSNPTATTDAQRSEAKRSNAENSAPHSKRSSLGSPSPASLKSFPKFADVSGQIGVEFKYSNGATGLALMVETTGGGAGWLDYDGDGLLDLYLCQGGNPQRTSLQLEPADQLFRQVEPGRFQPVADVSAIDERGYSIGVAVGDFDDDGFDDIYVTNVGPNTLLHNQGDGTFRDVSIEASVANPLWSTSAAWSDLDGDGNLDLYVCNYVNYDPYHPLTCKNPAGNPGTCHPRDVAAVPDECYFNQGDGAFTAEAERRGLFGSDNKGLGVVIADLNNDGLPDVYVANDTTPNFLFINQGAGQFKESAKLLGCAVSREGSPQASMGVALGDFDHNGWLDLYCTHFTQESNTLYKNLGLIGFQDVTGLVGLHSPTYMKLGFGTIMTDFNQDGHEDIFVTNGHIDDWRSNGEDLEMNPQLFSYQGPRFVDCSSEGGEFFRRKGIGRGVACGDFDNDGDWDLAVVHQNSPTAILRNDSPRGHWLKLRLIATNNRRGVGTRVALRQGNRTLVQELAGGVSYCSAHERALIFGLGDFSEECELEIRWPDGAVQSVQVVTIDQQLTVRQNRSAARQFSP